MCLPFIALSSTKPSEQLSDRMWEPALVTRVSPLGVVRPGLEEALECFKAEPVEEHFTVWTCVDCVDCRRLQSRDFIYINVYTLYTVDADYTNI